MHCQIIRTGEDADPISLFEWRTAVGQFPNFVITDELKQQNPFTKEFLMASLPGSGYWKPNSADHIGWPHDGTVWFRYDGEAVNFIQYSNAENPELIQIARILDASVEIDE